MDKIGKYVDLKRIGHGGMAVVYIGRDPHLDRRVAIKVILPHLAMEETFEDRFRLEARLAASLRHPNIIHIYEFDFQENTPYMVMEYLDGGTLKDLIIRYKQKRERMPLGEIARILSQITNGLDFAHSHGTVHRDIKPSNIMISNHGIPIIVDFGVAKILDASLQLTNTGGIVGSPPYLSPEQAASQPIEKYSDIYSLGIVIYEMATGRVPFVGTSVSGVLMQHIMNEPPAPREFNPNIPTSVQDVISKALAKDPRDRFQSAGEFSAAFQRALEGVPIPEVSPDDKTEVGLQKETSTLFSQKDIAELPTEVGREAATTGAKEVALPLKPAVKRSKFFLPALIIVGVFVLIGVFAIFNAGGLLSFSSGGGTGEDGEILLYTSLQDEESIRNPGTGLGGFVSLLPEDFVRGQQGKGVLITRGDASCELIDFQEVVFPAWRGDEMNINLEDGELTFWYQPQYNSNDAEGYYNLFNVTVDGSSPSSIYLVFDEGNINFVVVDSGRNWMQTSPSFRSSLWKSGDWVHFRVVWDAYEDDDSMQLYVNNARVNIDKVPGGWNMDEDQETATQIFIGTGPDCGDNPANGIIDELTIKHFP